MRASVALVIVCSIVRPASPAVTAPSPSTEQRSWLGPDGTPLPFDTDEEILEFLKTAEIVSTERIPVGVTRPRRAILQKDGIRVQATLKSIDETEDWVRLSDGTHAVELRDYFLFEYAAYELARLLGIDSVPPTVIRRDRVEPVSLQLWIENGMTEAERRERQLQPPGARRWIRQVQTMYLFDDLIGNDDRNRTNILIDDRERYWMIDHTRAFQIEYELQYVRGLIWVERTMWERLQSLDRETVERRIDSLISGRQLAALLERRDRILAEVRRLLSERGEAAVLFDWKAPEERAGAEERMTGREPSSR